MPLHYDQQLRSGEWYYADETLKVLLEQAQLTSPIIKHLFLTGLPSSCHDSLVEMEQAGNQQARVILEDVKKQLSISISDRNKQGQPGTDTHQKKDPINPADFPPNLFDKLSEKLSTEVSSHGILEKWYAYWKEENKERWLIKELVPRAKKFLNPYSESRYLLDLLFQSQRKLAGKRSAYKLLVFAHQAMQGWGSWYESSKNSINRLRIVAEQYPDKVDDFIKSTSIRETSWYESTGKLIIPGAKLVFLFSQSGRTQEAKELTLSMVEGLEESVRNLNLRFPQWDWQRNDSIDDALLKVLVARIKYPVPYVKIHALQQLSELLISNYPNIEDLLKQDLASRKQESECVEVLCIFYSAHTKGYTCPQDLGVHIKARSTLSDLLLKEMISQPCELGEHINPADAESASLKDPHNFERNQGTQVPLLYHSKLEEEEKRTGLPLTMHYKIEWNTTYKYLPAAETQIDYFLSSDRHRSTGQFYTQASHRGRTAYLRVLEFAKQNYGMPNNYAEHLATLALPIDPAYLGLKQKKPSWLPEWNSTDDADFLKINNFIKLALNNFASDNESEVLLALSFPLKLNEHKWFEVSVVRATNLKEVDNNSTMKNVLWSLYQGMLLEPELSYEYLNEEKNHLGIMAAESFPFNRYGHWHSDSRNFFVPLLNIKGSNITGQSQKQVFCYYYQGVKIGHSSFWYDKWLPYHPIGISSLSGTYTLLDKEKISLFGENINLQPGYICNIKTLCAKKSYESFEEDTFQFHLLDQDIRKT